MATDGFGTRVHGRKKMPRLITFEMLFACPESAMQIVSSGRTTTAVGSSRRGNPGAGTKAAGGKGGGRRSEAQGRRQAVRGSRGILVQGSTKP